MDNFTGSDRQSGFQSGMDSEHDCRRIRRPVYSTACLRSRLCPDRHVYLPADISDQRPHLCNNRRYRRMCCRCSFIDHPGNLYV